MNHVLGDFGARRWTLALAVNLAVLALWGIPGSAGAQADPPPPAPRGNAQETPPAKPPARPLILVTNDEGIRSPGLRALATALRELGDVIVAAPTGRRLGASQSLPLPDGIMITKLDVGVFAIDSTPAGCVAIAAQLLTEDRRFALAVSGIGGGATLGAGTNISGAVGAARMAADLGIPAIAVSLSQQSRDIRAAASFATRLAKEALARKLEANVVLNVNLPAGPSGQWRHPLLAPLGKGVIKYRFAGTVKGDDTMRVRPEIERADGPLAKGSDGWAHAKGHITMTVLPVLTARAPPKYDFDKWEIFKKPPPPDKPAPGIVTPDSVPKK